MVESQEIAAPESKEVYLVESIEAPSENQEDKDKSEKLEIKESISFSDLNMSESVKEKEFNKGNSVHEAAPCPPVVSEVPEKEESSGMIPIESKQIEVLREEEPEPKKAEPEVVKEGKVAEEERAAIEIPPVVTETVQVEREGQTAMVSGEPVGQNV